MLYHGGNKCDFLQANLVTHIPQLARSIRKALLAEKRQGIPKVAGRLRDDCERDRVIADPGFALKNKSVCVGTFSNS